jgi:hypothetical protein
VTGPTRSLPARSRRAHTVRVDPESELLGDEPVRLVEEPWPTAAPPRRSHHRRAWWGVLLALAVIAGAVVVADTRARSREDTAVTGCERRLQIATAYAERSLGLVTNYLRPPLRPSGRVQQLHLADLMSARAGRVLPRVQRADRFCRAVGVQPWHFSLVSRQSASTAYSAALVTLVQIVAAQGRAPFRDEATLQRLREAVGVDGG